MLRHCLNNRTNLSDSDWLIDLVSLPATAEQIRSEYKSGLMAESENHLQIYKTLLRLVSGSFALDNEGKLKELLKYIFFIAISQLPISLFQLAALLLFLPSLLSGCAALKKPMDCSDILEQNQYENKFRRSGVHTIYPFAGTYGVQVTQCLILIRKIRKVSF